MGDAHVFNQTSYTPVGDIIVLGLCFILTVILGQTYIYRNRHFKILTGMIMSMFGAAFSNILYQLLLIGDLSVPLLLYLARTVHFISLTLTPILYITYLEKPLWISSASQKKITRGLTVILAAAFLTDAAGTIFGFGFCVSGGTLHKGFNPYIAAYVLLTVMIFYIIVKYRSRVIKQIYRGLMGVNAVSVAVLAVQGFFHQNSFTSACYFFIVLGIVFMFHTNPYDIDTGAVTDSFFTHEICESTDKNRRLIIICCHMIGFSRMIKESKELKYELYGFFRHNLKRGILYRFPDDRLVFTVPAGSDTDQQTVIDKMVVDFKELHSKFRMDYRIVIIETGIHLDF